MKFLKNAKLFCQIYGLNLRNVTPTVMCFPELDCRRGCFLKICKPPLICFLDARKVPRKQISEATTPLAPLKPSGRSTFLFIFPMFIFFLRRNFDARKSSFSLFAQASQTTKKKMKKLRWIHTNTHLQTLAQFKQGFVDLRNTGARVFQRCDTPGIARATLYKK